MSDEGAGVGAKLVMAGMGLATLGTVAFACLYVLWMTQTRSATRNASMDLDELALVFCVAAGPASVAGLLTGLLCAIRWSERRALGVVAPLVAASVVGLAAGSACALALANL